VLSVVRMLFYAEARRRWRSWLLLSVLVALTTGLIVAGVSAGHRTAAAFPRFVATHGYDAVAYSSRPLPQLAGLHEVKSVERMLLPANGAPSCACVRTISEDEFSVYVAPTKTLTHVVNLVSGQLPDPSDPDQVLASFPMQDYGVHVGTVIRVPLYATWQRPALGSGVAVAPRGPTVFLHVVGLEAAESDFPGDNGTPEDGLYATSALTRSLGGREIYQWIYYVRLAHGATDLPRFESDAQALGALGSADQDTTAASVASSIHPQAIGWWILAVLAAVVGLIVVAQALARQSRVEAENHGVLRALGLARGQLVLLGLTRTLAIGLVGISAGIGLGVLLSPLTPVGEARLAESSRSFDFDVPVSAIGAAVALVLLLGIALLSDLRTMRAESLGQTRLARPSPIVTWLTSVGVRPSVLIGVRRALERGGGRNSVPIGSAILGSILAVTALCATSVFGASLSHLTASPTLYGQPFDVFLNIYSSPTAPTKMLSDLQHTRGITRITGGFGADVRINGKTVDALAGDPIRGNLLLTTVSGRPPRSSREISLGATTMRELGTHVGLVVAVTAPVPGGGLHTSSFRVVGTTVFPPDFGAGGLGTGAVFTYGGFLGAQCASGRSQASCEQKANEGGGGVYLLRFSRGADGVAARSGVARHFASAISYPVTPSNLVNFGEAVNFPLIFGVVLIVFGITTLVHVLVVSVARRKREVGILRALGFVRRQIAYSVWWQTMTIALVGLLVGVPAGIAVGRSIWQEFARNLGVLPVTIVGPWVLLAVAAGTVVVATVVAIGPAMVAGRSRPDSLLRSE
jgi:hypothetical protein